MQIPSGPPGASFEENGVTYDLLPNAFSGNGIRAMKRGLYASRLDRLGPSPSDREISSLVNTEPTYQELFKALQSDPYVISAAMSVCCPQTPNIQEANKFIGNYPDVPAVGMLISTVASGLDEAGNSSRSGARAALLARNKQLQDKLVSELLGESSETNGKSKGKKKATSKSSTPQEH